MYAGTDTREQFLPRHIHIFLKNQQQQQQQQQHYHEVLQAYSVNRMVFVMYIIPITYIHISFDSR